MAPSIGSGFGYATGPGDTNHDVTISPPGLAPAGSGQLRGLGFGSTAVDILAGLMTGLCRMVADDLAALESTVEQPTEVVLGGGALAGSGWWRRAFVAAFAPRSVWHQRNPEIGATGAALVSLGRIAEAAHLGGISRTDERNPPNTATSSPPQ